MAIVTGFCIAGVGRGKSVAAEPPPPFVPPYSAQEALERLTASACGRALGRARLEALELDGWEDADGPRVALHVEVVFPPSSNGVELHTRVVVGLVATTGEVEDPARCIASLRGVMDQASRALAAAEASPDVKRFLADHASAAMVRALFSDIGPRGQITFVANTPSGPEFFVWQ